MEEIAGASNQTVDLLRHVAKIANGDLQPRDIEAVRRLLLDCFVVSLWGSTRPAARELAQWSARFAGTGSSWVLGGKWRAEPSVAALVFGTAGHSYELDDTHDETASHPGCVVIPAALAVGAATGASQAELFRAIAAGYEAMALIGCAAGGMDTVHNGFHPTSVFGSFGAATACLSLYAFEQRKPVDEEMLATAWGHALSQACGSMPFSVESRGGEVKRLHAGLGARNGVLAAQFAQLPAMTAPHRSVDGTYGVAGMFGGAPRQVTPGEEFQIHVISLKPYSCCRLFHSTIDALARITDDFSVATDDIADILITGPRLIADQHMTPARSTMTAQYSCPYVVGATLAYGPTRYDVYGEDFLDDPAILDIAAKVRFEIDAELERRYYPKQFATSATIRFNDGTTRTAMVVDSVGTTRNPMSRAQILAKGDGLALRGDLPSGAALADAIWDDSRDAAALLAAVTGNAA
ncbi:MmgE/PrpD family protein [Sphingomonas sp. CL5.1]|uniref:MmgE/PrpD family protein n=1 Tax=Sphingomonas sp. CL5.1 TaxID=2653203 RepID=UPI0015839618|nr:MmgE/PrpD family protein [Sphingomonas sp. CL5.1]QKS01100.1 MmgE/PrpD family protein [Sphingomonas sp. CL5.1]